MFPRIVWETLILLDHLFTTIQVIILDRIKLAGLYIILLGIVLFLFSLRFLGSTLALLGVLVPAANSFRRRVRLQGTGLLLVVGGWATFAAGALISFAGFLLASEVKCFCPATGPCACFVPLYNAMFEGGLIGALLGLVGIAGGSILSWREPGKLETPGSPHIGKKNVGKRTVTVLAIVLTVVVVFGLFSYWPGVYITGIDESTQFIGGMPSPLSPVPFMTSPTSQPTSGFHNPIGGSFTYILHFNSVSSYPNYKIDTISVSAGFSVSSNTTLPLAISPNDPSVSVVLDVHDPYYPFYGTVAFFLAVENLNGGAP